ncbi:MAG TPA: LacI family DNA-binding transcriptional regulator [Kiritimatiellia bacterium]|nr:LacI family DNA-binding transcriptional regulator [Kiritimatiellia bacterium]
MNTPLPSDNLSPPRRTRRSRSPRTKPTILDVARRANVSAATVSYALNGRTQELTQATVDRVLAAARELGYVKNLAAAALSGKKTRLIAVVFPTMNQNDQSGDVNPFYGEFIFRLEHAARKKGYGLCIYGGTNDEATEFLLQRGAETAILVGATNWTPPESLALNDVHCILYDTLDDTSPLSQVRTNEIKGGYLAAERLIDLRRPRMLFLGDVQPAASKDVVSLRYHGARTACSMAEIDPLPHHSVTATYDGGFHAAEAVIAAEVQGVVTAADIVAAGLIDGLQERGIRVPEDITVVGYDNLPIARVVRPRLTTIDQGLAEKVQAIMTLIDSRAHGEMHIIDPKIVLRESA